jgi:hypothetical protein
MSNRLSLFPVHQGEAHSELNAHLSVYFHARGGVTLKMQCSTANVSLKLRNLLLQNTRCNKSRLRMLLEVPHHCQGLTVTRRNLRVKGFGWMNLRGLYTCVPGSWVEDGFWSS